MFLGFHSSLICSGTLWTSMFGLWWGRLTSAWRRRWWWMVQLYGERWGRQEHQMGITHQHITPQELYGVQGVSREHVDLVIVVGHCQDRDVCQDPVISPSRPWPDHHLRHLSSGRPGREFEWKCQVECKLDLCVNTWKFYCLSIGTKMSHLYFIVTNFQELFGEDWWAMQQEIGNISRMARNMEFIKGDYW